MRKFVISALAVVAMGATFAGAKTARATERWISSGWVGPGFYPGVTIPGGFTTNVDINDPAAILSTLSVATTGVKTNSQFTNATGNCSGTAGHYTCPTTHWAFTLCSDNTFITGPIELDYRTNLTQQPTASWTGNNVDWGSGRWTFNWGPAGDTTGMCSDLTGAFWVAGGLWMYQYSP
jgi:hypothetical protein